MFIKHYVEGKTLLAHQRKEVQTVLLHCIC